MPAILIQNLHKTYSHFSLGFRLKKFGALRNVSLSVRKGTIHGLLGLNGAGKSTLIKILATLILPTKGRCIILGRDVAKKANAVKQLIGFINSNERSFYYRLTGRQNLEFFAALYGTQNGIANAIRLTGSSKWINRRFDTYSSGMRQRLALARGLLNNPEVILADEPTLGLDIKVKAEIHQYLIDLVKKGKTVLLATHDMEEAKRLCDHISVIQDGRITSSFENSREHIPDRGGYQDYFI
ncbi:MAG: ABC transporter ATP-binding protein [archaeon]